MGDRGAEGTCLCEWELEWVMSEGGEQTSRHMWMGVASAPCVRVVGVNRPERVNGRRTPPAAYLCLVNASESQNAAPFGNTSQSEGALGRGRGGGGR